jgi:hypothetical protein
MARGQNTAHSLRRKMSRDDFESAWGIDRAIGLNTYNRKMLGRERNMNDSPVGTSMTMNPLKSTPERRLTLPPSGREGERERIRRPNP